MNHWPRRPTFWTPRKYDGTTRMTVTEWLKLETMVQLSQTLREHELETRPTLWKGQEKNLDIVIRNAKPRTAAAHGLRSTGRLVEVAYSMCAKPGTIVSGSIPRDDRTFEIYTKISIDPRDMKDSSGCKTGQIDKARKEAERILELSKAGYDSLPRIFFISPLDRDDIKSRRQVIAMEYLIGQSIGVEFRQLSETQKNVLAYIVRNNGHDSQEDIIQKLFQPKASFAQGKRDDLSKTICQIGEQQFMDEITFLKNLGYVDIIPNARTPRGPGIALLPANKIANHYEFCYEEPDLQSQAIERKPYAKEADKHKSNRFIALEEVVKKISEFQSDTKAHPWKDKYLEPETESPTQRMNILERKLGNIHRHYFPQPPTKARDIFKEEPEFMERYKREILDVLYSNEPQDVVQGDANVFNFMILSSIDPGKTKIKILDLFHMKKDHYLSDFVDLLQSARVLTGISREEYDKLMDSALDLRGLKETIERRRILREIVPRLELHRSLYVLGSIAGTIGRSIEGRSPYEKKDLANQFNQYKEHIARLVENSLYSPELRKDILNRINGIEISSQTPNPQPQPQNPL